MHALDRRYAAAQDLAARAGAMALSMQPPPGAAHGTLKAPQDWLTDADGAVERFLSEALLSAFPDDGFIGEETGQTRAGGLHWVIDPIDGTSNFARGGTRWCVSIGLLDGRTPLLGVLSAAALAETYAACTGRGATLNGAPARAAGTQALNRAIIECGWSPRVTDGDYLALCARVRSTGAVLRAGGSGALGLAETAAGRIDAYAEQHINLWDAAGALALLAEAGAVVSGFMDGDGMALGGPILAAAPGIATALEAAAALGG